MRKDRSSVVQTLEKETFKVGRDQLPILSAACAISADSAEEDVRTPFQAQMSIRKMEGGACH